MGKLTGNDGFPHPKSSPWEVPAAHSEFHQIAHVFSEEFEAFHLPSDSRLGTNQNMMVYIVVHKYT